MLEENVKSAASSTVTTTMAVSIPSRLGTFLAEQTQKGASALRNGLFCVCSPGN
jgi:hypothetical protein